MLESNLDINQIKTNLKNTLNIEMSNINTKEDLSEDNLLRLKNELENKLNQSNQDLKQALRKKINEYRRNLEQKDRLTRETYKFLKSIGFDKIPQSITNNVIQQLNSNSGLRSSLGMTSEIDLSNGNL
jgi:CII-binding regulator of phage lambda lysogenization HflD